MGLRASVIHESIPSDEDAILLSKVSKCLRIISIASDRSSSSPVAMLDCCASCAIKLSDICNCILPFFSVLLTFDSKHPPQFVGIAEYHICDTFVRSLRGIVGVFLIFGWINARGYTASHIIDGFLYVPFVKVCSQEETTLYVCSMLSFLPRFRRSR